MNGSKHRARSRYRTAKWNRPMLNFTLPTHGAVREKKGERARQHVFSARIWIDRHKKRGVRFYGRAGFKKWPAGSSKSLQRAIALGLSQIASTARYRSLLACTPNPCSIALGKPMLVAVLRAILLFSSIHPRPPSLWPEVEGIRPASDVRMPGGCTESHLRRSRTATCHALVS